MRCDALAYDIEGIIQLASEYGWVLKARDKAPKTLEFLKENEDGLPSKMMVWYSTGRVATTVNHPTKGRNQMYRTEVGWGLLEELFKNPRLHTDRGYRRREHRR